MRLKKVLPFALSFCLTIGSCVSIYAKTSDTNLTAPYLDEVTSRSTTSIRGPLPGAKQRGSVKKLNSHQNLTNASAVIGFLAAISGVPVSYYLATSSLVTNLLANNTENQYYTRTIYYSSDSTMYYYKYDYYTDSSYSKKIGTDYSFCYTLLS